MRLGWAGVGSTWAPARVPSGDSARAAAGFCHRSHFGSRYTLGCCDLAGLFREYCLRSHPQPFHSAPPPPPSLLSYENREEGAEDHRLRQRRPMMCKPATASQVYIVHTVRFASNSQELEALPREADTLSMLEQAWQVFPSTNTTNPTNTHTHVKKPIASESWNVPWSGRDRGNGPLELRC